jgi:hypothetical protein
MIELIKSILEASRERLKSPVLGTYSISFILINWRSILFLFFSDATIENKIIVINSEYCVWGAILWPIVMTLFITFGIPYFMWLVDLGIAKSKHFRRIIRHDEKVIGLDNEIIIASKEFEIQNRKSGTKTIESLQDTITLLEKEKQALIGSGNAERESSLYEIKRLNDLVKSEIEKNIKKNSENLIEFSESVFEMYNNLKQSDKLNEFYEYFDGYSSSLNLDDETIRYYKNLGLAKFEINGYIYTKLGFELYHFLFESINSREVKKRMVSIIEKFNNHEVQIFKKLPAQESIDFALKDGFRNSLVNEIVEFDIFKKTSNKNYSLTKIGVAFRNLLALNEYNEL